VKKEFEQLTVLLLAAGLIAAPAFAGKKQRAGNPLIPMRRPTLRRRRRSTRRILLIVRSCSKTSRFQPSGRTRRGPALRSH
jgi:hypothetical protein